MNCPKCGKQMSWYVDGLIRPGGAARRCSSCQTTFHVLNSYAGIMINSVLLAAGFVLAFWYQAPLALLWVCLMGIGCWLLLPVWTRMFGRFVIWSDKSEPAVEAERLGAESFASTITMGAWVLYMAIMIVIPYARILSSFDPVEDEAWNRMQEFTAMIHDRLFSTRGIIEMGAGVLSFLWCQSSLGRRALHRKRTIEDKIIGRHAGVECSKENAGN